MTLWQRIQLRCEFCPGGGLLTQHGLCTDPRGEKGECFCYVTDDTHRYQHHLVEIESSPAEMDMNEVGWESERPTGF